MENLDSAVLATALPSIAQAFGESPLKLNLAITSYLFSLAVFIPVSGWMADRFGARTIFACAITVFALASALCGLSESIWELVGGRILQGIGGAMMVPVGRLVVLRSIEKAELVRAMAFLTTPALIGPVLGPPLGGFLTTYFSWRWIFWINLPIAALGVVLVLAYIPNLREAKTPPLDAGGFLLAAIGLCGVVFGFETVGRGLLPIWMTVGLLVIGIAGLWAYRQHARMTTAPLLDLTLMRVPTFRSATIGAFLFRVGIGAVPFLLPLMMQLGFGKSAFESGMITFASALGALTMKTAARSILKRFGFRPVVIANAVIAGSSILAMGFFRPDWPTYAIIIVLLIGGFFRSLQFTATNALTVADITRQRMSAATSFSATAQQLSLSAGVAIGALVLHVTVEWLGGGHPTPDAFTPAFLLVGLCAMLSSLAFLPLPEHAGAELSGRGLPKANAAPAPTGE